MKSNEKSSCLNFALSLIFANFLSVLITVMVTALFGSIFGGKIAWIATVLSIIAYCFFFYHEGWLRGGADYNLVQYGRAEKTPWKAVLAGLIADIPTVIFGIMAILVATTGFRTFSFIEQDISVYLYRLWNMAYAPMFDTLASVPALHFLPIVFVPILAELGYAMGYRQLRVSDYLIYSRKEK
ncbi:MAG: hypothetical protein RSC43_01495 [Clostridia bacterium]